MTPDNAPTAMPSGSSSAAQSGLAPLVEALLRALAEAPPGKQVSLPRLGKQLGQGASVLMRQLSLMGDTPVGGVAGPGWVRVEQQDGGWRVSLTELGRAQAELLSTE